MMLSAGKLRPLSFSHDGEDPPAFVSSSTPWGGIPFEVHCIPALEDPQQPGIPVGERGILIPIQGTQTWVLRDRRCERQVFAMPGTVAFVEAGSPFTVTRMIGECRAAVFGMQTFWNEILADGGPVPFSPLASLPASQTVLSLARAMVSEVENGAPTGRLFAESLSLALLQFVVERSPVSSVAVRGSMSGTDRRRIARYIEDNLHRDVSLSELAGIAALSRRHFSTLFRNAFGVSPHRYLIERRLVRGARLLQTTNIDIAELALGLGFSSQSHFSSAFRKRFGVSPRSYALSRRSSSAGG